MPFRSRLVALTVALLALLVPGRGKADPPAAPAPARAEAETIVCTVEGDTTIRFLLPAGRRVVKGELICELDPAPVKARLELATLEVRRTEAALSSARLAREAAELAVNETEAEIQQGRDELRNAVTLAEKELELAGFLHDEAVRRKARDADLAATQANVQKARLKLEQAQSRLSIFEKQTAPKRAEERRTAVAAARIDEQAAGAAKEAVEAAAERLRQQLKSCRILAPVAGMLLYVRPPGTLDEGSYVVLEKGVVVHKRQPLFRIVVDRPVPRRTGPAR
jgi:multidrug efflux pump subunit AcrA (membrane-fusion protein)